MPKTGAIVVAGLMLSMGLAIGACVQVGTGGGGSPGGGGGGGAGEGGVEGGVSGGSASDASAGTNCTVQTTGGSMLCEGLGRCPSVTVDQNTFMQCGFAISGSAAIFECECSGYLCSGGMASTCTEAAAVLQGQTSVSICNQLSTGGCTFEAISTTGSGAGTSSACNTSCESTCVGDPACIQGCGC